MGNMVAVKRDLEDAEEFLRNGDAVMDDLISRYGPCTLNMPPRPPFHLLVGSIISQQLSSKVAETISSRLETIVGTPFLPSTILRTSDHLLRAAGISAKKMSCIKEIAKRAVEDDLSFENMAGKSDDEIVQSLIRISGIGRWTTEMFLIFGLKRLDVFSRTDAGLRRAIKILYSNVSGSEMDPVSLSERWRPYRSVASWYLWRSLDSPSTK